MKLFSKKKLLNLIKTPVEKAPAKKRSAKRVMEKARRFGRMFSDVSRYRILLLVTGILYPIWNLISLKIFLPHYTSEFPFGLSSLVVNLLNLSWLFPFSYGITCAFTFKNKWMLKHIYSAYLANVYLMTFHLMALTSATNFSTYFTVCQFILIFSIAPTFRTSRSFFLFLAFYFTSALVLDLDNGNVHTLQTHPRAFFIMGGLTITIYSFIMLSARLMNSKKERMIREELLEALGENASTKAQLKDALNEVTRNKEFLDSTINSIPDPLFIKSADGTYLVVNDVGCSLFGLKPEQIVGKTDAEVFPPEIAQVFIEEDKLTRKTKLTSVQKKVPTALGIRDFETKKRVITSPNGEEVIIGIIRDITDEKKKEFFLSQTTEALDLSQKISKVGTFQFDLTVAPIRIWLSDQLYANLGCARGDFYPTMEYLVEQIHPEDRSNRLKALEYAMNRGGSFTYEARALKNGVYAPFRFRGHVTLDDNDKPCTVTGTLQDISDILETQKILMENEERMRMAIEIGQFGTWAYDIEREHVIWSKTKANMFGLKDMGGEKENYRHVLHPDDVKEVYSSFEQAIAKKKPFEATFRINHPEKGLRWISEIGKMVSDNDGKNARIIGVSVDITDRKISEDILIEEKRYAELMRGVAETINMSEGFESSVIKTLKLIKEFLGWPVAHAFILPDKITGETRCITFWNTSDDEQFSNFITTSKSLSLNGPVNAEKGLFGRIVKENGPIWITDVQNAPNFPRNQQGVDLGIGTGFGIPLRVGSDVVGLLEFYIEDTTLIKDMRLMEMLAPIGIQLGRVVERKRYAIQREQDQKKLTHAAKLSNLGELASNIGHEINTPLASVSAYAQRILYGYKSGKMTSEKAITLCESMYGAVNRISDIITGLKQLSRQESNAAEKTFTLNETINQALSLSKGKMSDKKIRLMVEDYTLNRCVVSGMPIQLFQVLVNLLNNSYDAVKDLPESEERWIRIEVKKAEKDMLELSVTNSGPKIPEDVAARVFEQFFTTKGEVGNGTGLGLSISKTILESHKGTLLLDMKAEYTRFAIQLPEIKPISKAA